ncbi:muscle M-line assembly protein unc-89 isoform X2 [Phthorimaea operculella]|nr:muscle M-line assembly protein unc-89 isoform X2 [Phthorimaea operculella]
MNSALKPVLPTPGSQPGGQASPAKANVASANHAVGHPQGAQNSLNHGSNNLVGQNLTHHAPAPPPPAHPVPSMAPVTANMAQMAQNMSHHGNLSHVTQNSVAPTNMAASPNKSASTSAPLSLVADKPVPLALTRTPEKKDSESPGPANGTAESPKSAANASAGLKPQNSEPNKEKQDIAKTSPSTPKPPEKPASVPTTAPTNAPATPQKVEPAVPVSTADGPSQPKVATANEAPEKSPSKPAEPKPAPTADVAPSQSDSKPVPESAKDSQVQQNQEKPATAATPQKADQNQAKPEPPVAAKTESPPTTMKLATVTPPIRKRRHTSPKADGPTPAKKAATEDPSTPDSRKKRQRTQVQLYQSPTPELTMATKLSASAGRQTPTKPGDDKLIVFYKNEYLAVRNAEGGFYVCQTMQNVYRTSRKIKIRWLSQDKSDPSGETYKPDFYDVTDMECVLTTLSLSRAPAGGGAQLLKPAEEARAKSILERALKAEQSGAKNIEVSEEHPDGLDLSLYTDESQLEKKGGRKRGASKSSPRSKETASEPQKEAASPAKKARTTPKRTPPSARKPPPKPAPPKQTPPKRTPGSTPTVAPASKTATAVTEKAKGKTPTPKRTPAKAKVEEKKPATPATPATPVRAGRRSAAKVEAKPTPPAPVPSTSTGKTTRTPRKPPSKK